MAWRHGVPNRLSIRREVERLVRYWPRIQVHVKRRREVFNEYGEQVRVYDTIYTGPALSRPSGGTSETYGLGTVENYDLVMLINGVFDIRQGDIVTINDGREYEVQFPPVQFGAFTELRLEQHSQIGQPT